MVVGVLNLIAALGASAVTAGIAIGSLVGGAVVARHSVSAPFMVAIVVSAVAAPAVWATGFLRPPGQRPATGTAAQPVQAQQNVQLEADGGQ